MKKTKTVTIGRLTRASFIPLLAILTSVMLLMSCGKTSIRGSGNTITETRNVVAFTGVQAQGTINVEVKKGAQQKVEVRGYENLVPVFETFVTNGTLVVKIKNEYYNIHNSNITVFIEVPDLQNISLDGSGDILLKDLIGTDLTASINGSGDLNASNCTYNNTAYRVNGSGNIRASQIASLVADAKIAGSGKIDVSCTQKLIARIDGSGEINYWGNPTVVETSISGSGHVRKK